MSDEVLAVVQASPFRRWVGMLMLATLAVLMLYVAISSPPAIGWQVFLVLLGAGALWMAQRMFQVAGECLQLTDTELRTGSGEIIVLVDDIVSVDRGLAAFKPSNGLLIKMKAAGPGTWKPGLWWRTGRTIGIGGVTPAGQTKFMYEVLMTLISQRA